MSKTQSLAAEAVTASMEDPVLIAQAGPALKACKGPYRMRKVFAIPGGDLCATFAIGDDHLGDHGATSPAFRSQDEGRTWRPWAFPYPKLSGMNPLISTVHDGEFLCIAGSSKGLSLDPERLPAPLARFTNIYGHVYGFHPLEACPPDVIAWHQDLAAVRWSPVTKAWSEERMRWDHRDQLIFHYNHLGYWTCRRSSSRARWSSAARRCCTPTTSPATVPRLTGPQRRKEWESSLQRISGQWPFVVGAPPAPSSRRPHPITARSRSWPGTRLANWCAWFGGR